MEYVSQYVHKHSHKWKNRSDWYWLWRLLQEVFELIGVLLGIHDDDMVHELNQIASICINWQTKDR